ncbi:uncharacterized protein JCM10292_000256 [Rhodotorula paludigena]|uniref:uncharacterized protein n=1 Tax=Rhodotorula paludigena TaxID=86838 RepID=UPI00316F4DAB
MSTAPRAASPSRRLRPAGMYGSLTSASLAAKALGDARDEAPASAAPGRRRPFAPHEIRFDDDDEADADPARLLASKTSMRSLPSPASSTSDLVMSDSEPSPSPFFVPPPLERPFVPATAEKENSASFARSAPLPRPPSPLPALPSAESSARNIRAPPRPAGAKSAYPPPLTAHNSLVAFKAAQALSSSQGGCSSDTHRTSSELDLEMSFDSSHSGRSASPSAAVDHSLVHVGPHSSKHDDAASVSLSASTSSRPSSQDWVGIDMHPAEHDIPESELVRSSSGQLVGARHSRATSALDLRAQFKAGERAPQPDVAITMLPYAAPSAVDDVDEARRQRIREGKRPLEGERAFALTAPLEQTEQFLDAPDSTYQFARIPSPYDPLAPAPRSAPADHRATFAAQQEQRPVPEPKRARAFPLPLRLLERTKRSAEALISPALSAASAFTSRSGAADSEKPSPLFESDAEDGTVGTAPSTPNDTPFERECFDPDETAPPVPHRLGSSAHGNDVALAGLGLSFGPPAHEDDFPVVPLRQSRRVSLPPTVTRRQSVRRDAVPAVAISPPPLERASEDSSSGTSSSTLSQDSAADPTVSPSRRLSRRMSASAHSRPARPVTVHFDRTPPTLTSPLADTHDTPTSRNAGGPSIPTPPHLLVTPSPLTADKRDPSFSFSPAPLRLVKVQLLRAAGYEVADPEPAPSAATSEPHKGLDLAPAPENGALPDTAIEVAVETAPRRRNAVWDDLTDLLSSSPAAWADEIVPAKLVFLAGFLLGPWCWILGGWYLRPLDGEFPAQRGQRCRDAVCGCGRIMRGSALREHQAHVGGARAKWLNPQEPERFAGLDKWVFVNRCAAGAGGTVVAVLFAVAVWAAATA